MPRLTRPQRRQIAILKSLGVSDWCIEQAYSSVDGEWTDDKLAEVWSMLFSDSPQKLTSDESKVVNRLYCLGVSAHKLEQAFGVNKAVVHRAWRNGDRPPRNPCKGHADVEQVRPYIEEMCR